MQLILTETFWDLHRFKLKERYYIARVTKAHVFYARDGRAFEAPL